MWHRQKLLSVHLQKLLGMLNKSHKAPLLFIAGSAFIAICTFLFNYGLLNLLEKKEYGVWSFQVGLAMLMFALLFEWVRVGAIRRGVLIKSWDGYFFSIYFFVYIIAFVITLFLSIDNADYLILGAYLSFHCMHEFILARYRLYDRKDLYVLMQFVKGVVLLFILLVLILSSYFKIIINSIEISCFLLVSYLCFVLCVFSYFHFYKKDFVVKPLVRFSKNRVEVLSKYSSLFFINSFVGLGFFYVDRVLLKGLGLNELVAENSAVMELVKQVVLFPVNIIGIYLYNRELKVANNKLLYSKVLNEKTKILTLSLLLVFLAFYVFNIFFAEFYFPSGYFTYWRENWLAAVLSISMYAVKVYFFDQFFISIDRLGLVLKLNLLMFSTYIAIFYLLVEFGGVTSVFSSMLVSLVLVLVLQSYVYFEYFKRTVV